MDISENTLVNIVIWGLDNTFSFSLIMSGCWMDDTTLFKQVIIYTNFVQLIATKNINP